MSRLLIDENPLVVQPSLAVEIGLNEAIVVQQIHYWAQIKAKDKSAERDEDGNIWIWNSVSEWEKQFPFWSARTIQRIIAGLEESGVIVSDVRSKNKLDRTKSYRINYQKIGESNAPTCRNDTATDWRSASRQVVAMPTDTETSDRDFRQREQRESSDSLPREKKAETRKAWEDEQLTRFLADWEKMKAACPWLPGLSVWGTTRDRAFRRILKDCDREDPRKTWVLALKGMTDKRKRWDDGSGQGVDHLLIPKNFLRYASWVDSQGSEYVWQS